MYNPDLRTEVLELRSHVDVEKEMRHSKVAVWILCLSVCTLSRSLRRTNTMSSVQTHKPAHNINFFLFFFCISFLQRITAETPLQTFISRIITLNKVNFVSSVNMIAFSGTTKFNTNNLALTKGEDGEHLFFSYFCGYHKCYYSCFDTLSKGHRLGVNFSRKKMVVFVFFCEAKSKIRILIIQLPSNFHT